MNRIGWVFLTLFGVVAASIALFVDFGSDAAPRRASPTAPVAEPVAVRSGGGALVLPVAGVRWRDVRDSWGEARGDGTRGHAGTDIMAPAGAPVVAAANGTIEKLFYSHGGGGITAYVRSPDRRLSYYYAHLAGYAAGVREGMRVRAGEAIGFVGDTGNAGAGNNHLHFGIERLTPGEPWYRGRAVDPYPLLAHGRPRR